MPAANKCIYASRGSTMLTSASGSLLSFYYSLHSAVVFLFITLSFVFQFSSSPGKHYAKCPACINTEPLAASIDKTMQDNTKCKRFVIKVLLCVQDQMTSGLDKTLFISG